jgi:hypothetical protein
MVHELGHDLVHIEEESGTEFEMQFLDFKNLCEVLGFNEDSLDNGLGKILNGFKVVFDFDDKRILVYDPIMPYTQVAAMIKHGKDTYNEEKARLDSSLFPDANINAHLRG